MNEELFWKYFFHLTCRCQLCLCIMHSQGWVITKGNWEIALFTVYHLGLISQLHYFDKQMQVQDQFTRFHCFQLPLQSPGLLKCAKYVHNSIYWLKSWKCSWKHKRKQVDTDLELFFQKKKNFKLNILGCIVHVAHSYNNAGCMFAWSGSLYNTARHRSSFLPTTITQQLTSFCILLHFYISFYLYILTKKVYLTIKSGPVPCISLVHNCTFTVCHIIVCVCVCIIIELYHYLKCTLSILLYITRTVLSCT